MSSLSNEELVGTTFNLHPILDVVMDGSNTDAVQAIGTAFNYHVQLLKFLGLDNNLSNLSNLVSCLLKQLVEHLFVRAPHLHVGGIHGAIQQMEVGGVEGNSM